MVVVRSGLLEKCKQEPDRPQSVVITLCKGKEQTPLSTLDLNEAEPIGEFSGLLKATLAGSKVLQLVDNPDIEAIEQDSEAHILNAH